MLPIDKNIFGKFGSFTLVIGSLLIILGTVGIIFPVTVSLASSFFAALLLIIGGSFWAAHTFKYNPRNAPSWLKPMLLLMTGGLLFLNPSSGAEAVGLLLALYLLLDAFGSFSLAQSLHPAKGWGWMVFNGMVSALLAILFLVGWPSTSLWLVGLYISISLLFDGWVLVAIGWAVRKGEPL